MRVEFFLHILEKYSNIKFHDNTSSWIQVVPCGRMDGRTDDEANSRFSQFCVGAQKEMLGTGNDTKLRD